MRRLAKWEELCRRDNHEYARTRIDNKQLVILDLPEPETPRPQVGVRHTIQSGRQAEARTDNRSNVLRRELIQRFAHSPASTPLHQDSGEGSVCCGVLYWFT